MKNVDFILKVKHIFDNLILVLYQYSNYFPKESTTTIKVTKILKHLF